MYETGHSTPPRLPQEEIRAALRRLEEALARHEGRLPSDPPQASDLPLEVLRRSVALMRDEANRLRWLLARG